MELSLILLFFKLMTEKKYEEKKTQRAQPVYRRPSPPLRFFSEGRGGASVHRLQRARIALVLSDRNNFAYRQKQYQATPLIQMQSLHSQCYKQLKDPKMSRYTGLKIHPLSAGKKYINSGLTGFVKFETGSSRTPRRFLFQFVNCK